jgi:hypothetical protein
MALSKRKHYALPPKNPPPSKVAGHAWDVKVFPNSKPGNTGLPMIGFPKPAATPPRDTPITSNSPRADFQKWVDHYTNVVGYYLCRLNGLQFNLDEEKVAGPPNKVLGFITEEFDKFAVQLHIGDNAVSGEYPLNPQVLVWPFHNNYYFRLHFTGVNGGVNYDFWVELWLYPGVDQDTLMCTNCLVRIRITDEKSLLDAVSQDFSDALAGQQAGQNPDYISSSSSYLATSSSSYP